MRPYKNHKNNHKLRQIVRAFEENWNSSNKLWYMRYFTNDEFVSEMMSLYQINKSMAQKATWIIRGGIARDMEAKSLFGFTKLTA